MSSSKDVTMRDLYESLSSKSKHMSAELGSVKSFLIGLRQELELIRTVYGNEEIMSIMKKAEDTRYELDLIKPELETLNSVLYELKSVLPVPRLDQQHASSQYEYTKLQTSSSAKYGQEVAERGTLKSQPESTRYPRDSEVRSIMKQYEVALQTLNSEYKSRMNDVQAATSELSSLHTQRESLLKELGTIKSELESTRSLYNSDEIQLIRGKIDSTKLDLSDMKQEKSRLEAEVNDMHSRLDSARSELAELLSEINNAKSKLDLKNKDVSTAKRELEFIEREMAQIHERDEIRKLVKASSAMIGEVNAKYLDAKKELEVLRKLLAEKNRTPDDSSNGGVMEFTSKP